MTMTLKGIAIAAAPLLLALLWGVLAHYVPGIPAPGEGMWLLVKASLGVGGATSLAGMERRDRARGGSFVDNDNETLLRLKAESMQRVNERRKAAGIPYESPGERAIRMREERLARTAPAPTGEV